MQVDLPISTTGNLTDIAGPISELESIGSDGIYTFEGQHDPFFPLVVATQHTQTAKLITGIAVAFARNPMIVANIGNDLQMLSKGRFILGLGSQIRPHIEKRYSSSWSHPAPRMREFILAVKAIWRCWGEGEKLDFRGEFYTHTLMTPFFIPPQNPYGYPPIWLAAVGAKMAEVAGEVADGLLVHPLSTPLFIKESILPALQLGWDKGQKTKNDFTISCQVITALGSDKNEIERAREQAKTQVAFYSSTPAYKPILDKHGWGEIQPKLNILSKQGDWNEMNKLISDEMLNQIIVAGTPEEAAQQIYETRGVIADRISPIIYADSKIQTEKLLTALKKF